ncbi:cobalt ABC transporter, inner membrane subunit CbiQ [Methanococcus vannielii SB]|uniref:Cobalt ABC transporter, inner membrane subunit CbiQ n=1 Tax=Methanococcus vannielii (strain ATCC 35089 / DSM 1224 / JCM 13029 / OCM 148 / SB) TaxID=406327 RepID=A6UN77_METVS|nr:cobalt ECF transporter T component CbiQ [Methanococcus vannielii]ABR53949.1 cobalt ABC transporter, inner membrane subunit CbiQ [Methanococcus vannielii SB]
MHNYLYELEKNTLIKSPIHDLDARVKLIFVILVVLIATIFNHIYIMVLLETYLIILLFFSKIPFLNIVKRILMILPFGIFIALFQPFIRGELVVFNLAGFNVYGEGLYFGTYLFLKFLVSITAIVFLSSTTPMYEVINAGRKLGAPNIISTLLGMMIRYLFLMYSLIESTKIAQTSRALNRKILSYSNILNVFGSLIGLTFLKSYEQGERTYIAMLSRGYSMDTKLTTFNEKIRLNDVIFLIPCLLIVILNYAF